jgi:hypothetical protein
MSRINAEEMQTYLESQSEMAGPVCVKCQHMYLFLYNASLGVVGCRKLDKRLWAGHPLAAWDFEQPTECNTFGYFEEKVK